MFDKLKSLFGFGPVVVPEPVEVEPERPARPEPAPASVPASASAPLEAKPAASSESAQGEAVLVHREVLDSAMGVEGVEFFIRGELRDKLPQQLASTRRFLDNMLLDQVQSLRGKAVLRRGVWVQLSELSLFRLGISRLPAQARVLLVPEDASVKASGEIREAVLTMQEAGIQVWLDDCLGSAWCESLAEVATGAIFRMALRLPTEADHLLKQAREAHPGLKLGAWDLGSLEDFELVRKLGCKHFSGSFVTRREDWSGNELTPQMLNVASMINCVREESNFRAIAQVLRQDIAMSYRLLRYANSAAQGLAQPISTIEQGLLILGQAQLDRWLTLVLLSGGAMGDTALTEMALVRARFLELCGSPRLPPEQCERLFVLGLFSMLDVALKVPIEAAIRPLRLPEDMNEALLHRKGPFGAYLALADACERGIGSEICKHALMLGLTTNKLSARQVEAINWVAELSAKPVERTED